MGGWAGWVGGWSETDNRAISVQLNLTGTATGTELGKKGNLLDNINNYKETRWR